MITMKMVLDHLRVWFLFWIEETRKAQRCYGLVKVILVAVGKWNGKDYSGYWMKKPCVLVAAMKRFWTVYSHIMEIEVFSIISQHRFSLILILIVIIKICISTYNIFLFQIIRCSYEKRQVIINLFYNIY